MLGLDPQSTALSTELQARTSQFARMDKYYIHLGFMENRARSQHNHKCTKFHDSLGL
jgi:hypothetical protein